MRIITYRVIFNNNKDSDTDTDTEDEEYIISKPIIEQKIYTNYQELLKYKAKNINIYNEIEWISIEQNIQNYPIIEDIKITEELPTNLITFICTNYNIVVFPDKLPANLECLHISHSALCRLPRLPRYLKEFTFKNNNKITTIDNFPLYLRTISFKNCVFENLPYIPDTVINISIVSTPLLELQNIPTALMHLHLVDTMVDMLPLSIIWCPGYIRKKIQIHLSGSPLYYRLNSIYNPNKIAVPIAHRWHYINQFIDEYIKPIAKRKIKKIEYWFLHCKHNSIHSYCKRYSYDDKYGELYVASRPNKKLKKNWN